MKTLALFILATLTVGITGCAARSAEMYRDDTRKVLATKKAAITECYDRVLQDKRDASGKVVVRFKVEADSGKITDAKVDKDRSDAPKALGKCIVAAIEGLTLDPGDEREGDATFTWTFEPKS
jgi:hypothetical protein